MKCKVTVNTSHYPKDVPWEVPEGWCWTTIGDCLINRDGERIPISSEIRIKQKNKVFDYYGAAGVIDKVDDYLFNERLLLIGEDGANLLSRAKDNAFFAEGKYWVNNHAHILDATRKPLLDYIALYINSIALDPYITGSAQPKLNQDNLNRIPVPLPPFMEQLRIIDSMAKSQVIIDIIAEKQKEIVNAISLAKSKILDLAIHGKLVPQDPSDEPAIELLKRINPDFVPSDNLHYEGELPQGWCVVRLGSIIEIISGTSFQKGDIVSSANNGIRILRGGNIQKGNIVLYENDVFVNEGLSNQNNTIHRGDIAIVASTGSSELIGKAAIAKYDYPNTQIGAFMRIIRPTLTDLSDYLGILFQSNIYKNHIRDVAKGTNINNIKSSYLTDFVISVPPLEEQHRIMERISELFSVVDNISNSTINDSK